MGCGDEVLFTARLSGVWRRDMGAGWGRGGVRIWDRMAKGWRRDM